MLLDELPESLVRDFHVALTFSPSEHRLVTIPLCLANTRIPARLSTSQTLTVPSAEAEINSRPSALVRSVVMFFLQGAQSA